MEGTYKAITMLITEEEYNEIIAQQQAKIAEIENIVYFEQ